MTGHVGEFEEVDELDESLAELLFNAYGDHCDWRAWDGRPMPSWSGINDAVRSHWVAVAVRARELLTT